MNKQSTLIFGAIFGGLAVAIGAFGAHALKQVLTAAGRTETFELAVRYQFYHALAMLATGIVARDMNSKLMRYAGVMFLLGILIFSGSLYTLSVTGLTWLGAITPIGGICFLAGWTLLVVQFSRKD
jgi:uncharacterized membrane protein YgdD (TMEM256/DUF423 family)